MKPTYLSMLRQLRTENRKGLAVLIDPDKASSMHLQRLVPMAEAAGACCFLVGGSLLSTQLLEDTLHMLRDLTALPLILFPGSVQQVSSKADGLLFLSLISGRNAEFLIGAHVTAAPAIKAAGIEVLPTGYMLIDGGAPTTASYISDTRPIPANKPDIAACTAMAGEMLGLQLFYLDTGSGAPQAVPVPLISAVKKATSLPLMVGGGIRTAEGATSAWQAGADMVVIGNALEENPELLQSFQDALLHCNAIQTT
mgnify:CR=1 FL=1